MKGLAECEGRVLRDGQQEPVYAYYLISDGGSDPTVAQTLGVKKQQIQGIRQDGDALFEQLQNDTNRIKDLARDFLQRNRVQAEEECEVTA
jgi:hypothetical protein